MVLSILYGGPIELFLVPASAPRLGCDFSVRVCIVRVCVCVLSHCV